MTDTHGDQELDLGQVQTRPGVKLINEIQPCILTDHSSFTYF